MTATEDLNRLYSEMVTTYNGGLSNTSTAKFDAIRDLFGQLFGLSRDDVYAVGAGTRPTNLPIRFSQGRQATQETDLGIGFLLLPNGGDLAAFTESATNTLRNYAERGRGHYKAMILVVVDDDAPVVTRMIKYQGSEFDSEFQRHFPGADIVDASATDRELFDGKAGAIDDSVEHLSLGGISEMFVADALTIGGLRFGIPLAHRFIAALCSKRFLILSGLAGSGKTKLAQAFARWLTPACEEGQHAAYSIIPVGADWTGNDNILGYPDGLDATRYVTRPALDLIQRAAQPENLGAPHFLILDEMNLSHVERYFADLLSLIESGETTELYRTVENADGETQFRAGVEPTLSLPPNLFIIGTVNVDETTYMFSPKVLDRANVIEFRMARAELAAFLSAPRSPEMDELRGLGIDFGPAFVTEVAKSLTAPAAVSALFEAELLLFFDLLSDHNAEFGFRVANESARFLHFYWVIGGYDDTDAAWFNAAMDAVIVQKLLPKLHGSRPKLEGLLWALAWACGADRDGYARSVFVAKCREAGRAQDETRFGPEVVEKELAGAAARYPLSFDKVMRMWRKLVRDQFVTFSEA